jgi:LysM repeat protein
VDRRRISRWAAPVAFLLAISVLALVVRAGFNHDKHHAKTQTTTVTSKRKKHHQGHPSKQLRTYTVESGDTLSTIASKTGTTVARLEQLNPGIDPTALRVGEKIRVQ